MSDCTPPAFLWTTADDGVVPCSNAVRYALALANHGITYELHVYPHGAHGLATASAEVNADTPNLARISRWMDDCAAFFRLYTEEKF